MRIIKHAVARVRNSDGKFEGIPALTGENLYDLAVRHGYIGTEDEFVKDIISDGWVNACLELEQNKVSITRTVNGRPLDKDVVIPSGAMAAYLSFINGGNLDATFGKNALDGLDDNDWAIGRALAMYAKYQNPHLSYAVNFPNMLESRTMQSIADNPDALGELETNEDIFELCMDSPYATSVLSSKITTYGTNSAAQASCDESLMVSKNGHYTIRVTMFQGVSSHEYKILLNDIELKSSSTAGGGKILEYTYDRKLNVGDVIQVIKDADEPEYQHLIQYCIELLTSKEFEFPENSTSATVPLVRLPLVNAQSSGLAYDGFTIPKTGRYGIRCMGNINTQDSSYIRFKDSQGNSSPDEIVIPTGGGMYEVDLNEGDQITIYSYGPSNGILPYLYASENPNAF